ncbi:hypothetical protein Rs2_48868 [Raphanus sativus]|nr:hypothetical protein Rs2_48868 [Raphanus sativus]
MVCSEPTILSSPAVLPYSNAPDMSSFFPSPTKDRTFDTAASPAPETEAPGPSSGQFNGKVAGISMRLRPDLPLSVIFPPLSLFLFLNLTNFNMYCYTCVYLFL